MATEITLNSRTTDNNDNAVWGVVEDTMVDEGNPTLNLGAYTNLLVQGIAGIRQYCYLHIVMPTEPKNAGRITSIKLYLYCHSGVSAVNRILKLTDLTVMFIEGTSNAVVDLRGCSWNDRLRGITWVDHNERTAVGGTIYATFDMGVVNYTDQWIYFDLTKPAFTWGTEKDLFMGYTTSPNNQDGFRSTNYAVDESKRPYLEIKYVAEQPEIPDAEDEILTIEPNPANPTQPLLKWKRPENQSLRLDNKGGYCLVKNNAIIDAITDGTLIARLNQGEEYIDTGAVLATGENDLLYYKVYFCDENNYIDGTGTGLMSGLTVYGVPTPSNQVWMIRPDVSTFVFDDYTPDVKQQVTATITAVVAGDFALTPSPVQHTEYQFDWKGDSTESGWVELETPANSHAKTHYYLGYQGATSAKARIMNSLGFWSDTTNSGSTVTVAAITPVSIVNVSPKAMYTSETILRVLGNLSYAQSSNETLTKYEFAVTNPDGDDWNAGTQLWVTGPVIWNDLLTVPYMDIPANKMTVAGSYTCQCRVTSSSFGVDASPDSTTMTVTALSATNMKTTLTNSNFETQNLGRKRIKSRHRVIEGTSEIIIDSGKEMPQIRISGHSFGVNIKTDEAQLLTWQDNDTYLRVYTDPQEGTPATYVEGWIEGLRFTKRQPKNVYWECNLVCRTASL